MREISKIWNCNSKGIVKNKARICGTVLEFDLSDTIKAQKEIHFEEEVDVNTEIDEELESTIKEMILDNLKEYDFHNSIMMPEKFCFNEFDGYFVEIYIGNSTTIIVDLNELENFFELPIYLENEVAKLFEFEYFSPIIETMCDFHDIDFEYCREIFMLRKVLYPNYKYSQIFDDETIQHLVNRTKIKNKIDKLKLNK